MNSSTARTPPVVDDDVFFFTYTDAGVTYELRRKFSSDDFSWMKSSEAKEAMALLLNIKHNLHVRKFPMDFLIVLRGALFEKFAKLGVSSDIIEPIFQTFNTVQEAMKERADLDVSSHLAAASNERRLRRRREGRVKVQ